MWTTIARFRTNCCQPLPTSANQMTNAWMDGIVLSITDSTIIFQLLTTNLFLLLATKLNFFSNINLFFFLKQLIMNLVLITKAFYLNLCLVYN